MFMLDWYNSHSCMAAGCSYHVDEPSGSLKGRNFLTSSVSVSLSGMILFCITTGRSHATGLCVVFLMHTDDQAIETLLHVYPYLSGRKYNFKAPVRVSFCNSALPKACKIINVCLFLWEASLSLTADRRESP